MGMKLEPTIRNEYLNSSYTPPGEDELKQLVDWNATEQPYSLHTCVPQLIATQAAATPAAVALVDGDRICTYKELNQRANQLAHYLQAQGVGPNVVVAVCDERSVEMYAMRGRCSVGEWALGSVTAAHGSE